jgi:Protein of unknown function (DUF1566)
VSFFPRFTLRGAAQVLDLDTDLIWTRTSLGKFNWKDAQETASRPSIVGVAWRLPTIQELLTLVDYERRNPAIDPIFKCESDWYWASTLRAGLLPYYYYDAWCVYFGDGASSYDPQNSENSVRAVRSRGLSE